MFLFVDHYEPKERTTDKNRQFDRVKAWVEKYPQLAHKHKDADGISPQHTWFYLVEKWNERNDDAVYLTELSKLCFEDLGEIELHIHHGPPETHCYHQVTTREKLLDLINQMKLFFKRFGALTTAEKVPVETFGFIHGKWALDNSSGGLYCGVNNELELLSETGCYADFTMPSGVSITQSKKINSIYYARGNPNKSKSYNSGRDVSVGGNTEKDLLIFQGPLDIHWHGWDGKSWKPVVESSNLAIDFKPSKNRIDEWINSHICIKGKPDWIFVKVHTHGTREEDFPIYFDQIADDMFTYLESKYNDGKNYILHYVSAREAYNIVKAAEAGETGDPNNYRDYLIKPYINRKIWCSSPFFIESYCSDFCKITILENKEKIHIKFKELMLKNVEATSIEKIHYKNEREKRCLKIVINGSGKIKCACELPLQINDLTNLKIEGWEIIHEKLSNTHREFVFASELVKHRENILSIPY